MPSWFLTFHQASDRYNCSPDPNKAIDPWIAMVLGQREHQAPFQCFGVHTCLFLWQEIDVYNPTVLSLHFTSVFNISKCTSDYLHEDPCEYETCHHG